MKIKKLPFLLLILMALTVSSVYGQKFVDPPDHTIVAGEDGTSGSRAEADLPEDLAAISVQYLPFVAHSPKSLLPPYDMTDFMIGDGRLYEVQHSNGSQARHQTQIENGRFFHTKGHEVLAEWEELWATSTFIYRGTDTSPGIGQYYSLRENGNYGSPWSPRQWRVGDLYERNPEVTFYWKLDCSEASVGFQRSWLRFDAYHLSYTFTSDITLTHVIELSWLPAPNAAPIETYFYAMNYGLVGWRSSNGDISYISEIHATGTRPDNSREEIPCLSTIKRRPVRSGNRGFSE